MPRLLILSFFFSAFIIPASPQEAGNYHVQQFTTENGLPSNLIRGIQWDNATGFLWIITESGLVRFNGVEFKSYIKEKISPIAPEKQVFAVKNNSSVIFISDGSGNIFEGKKNKPVLAKSSPGNTPFINYYFIAVTDDFFSAAIKKNPAFPETIEKILCLSDTSCLILYQNSIYLYGLNSPAPALVFSNIGALFEIEGNCFFINNKKQAFLLNKKSLAATPVRLTIANNSLLDFQNGSSQLFWKTGMLKPVIIKDNEAWQLNYSNGQIEARQITRMLPIDANISTVEYLEEKGMLFIGTDSKGIIVITQNKVLPKKRKNANPKNKTAYFSQIALSNGNILTNEGDIIGDKSGPYVLPAKGKFSNRTSFTNGNLIWYNSIDNGTGIYCLHQFNKTKGSITVFTKIKPLTQVAVTGGKTYLANNEGIGMLQGDSMFYIYRYPPNATNVKTYDFKELAPGVFAIAGCHGLLKFSVSDKKLDTLYQKENACFGSIWIYKDYIFWGSYGYGYYIYKNGRIKEMPIDKNDYLLYSHCFVEDANGNCWISTNRGLFKAVLNDIIINFETGTTPLYYHYYGQKDGIEMTELNGGCSPCAITLEDQTISFPSMDGLLWVNPATSAPELPAGDVYIDEIVVDGKTINPDSVLNTSMLANVEEIIIKLGFSAWCNKENIYIQYQFGGDKEWKPVNINNGALINLNNLAKGDYLLRIRKLNGFGVNNYSYKEIRFTIPAPWYERWWFYLLCGLLLTGLITLFFRYRTRQYKIRQRKLEQQVADKTKELLQQNEVLEKNNSIKTRLISIISHDIVTPLKFLTAAGKNLIEKRKLMTDELQVETIAEITNTSQELQLLSTNILNWIKYQNENRRMLKESFNLHELVDQVLGLLQTMAKQKNLLIENRINESMEIFQFYEPLKILVYNLLTNAIHFTEKGAIHVSATKTNSHIRLAVSDEGVGMTPDQVHRILAEDIVITSTNVDNKKGHGLGYLIIKDLIKTMGASIHIDSIKEKGTTVAVTLPATKNPREHHLSA
jgi:signal transduction histidine kinase